MTNKDGYAIIDELALWFEGRPISFNDHHKIRGAINTLRDVIDNIKEEN